MAAEKDFENKIKRYLKSHGVYALGTEKQKMSVNPVGYYEKRWGGGTFLQSGMPDLHIVIRGISLELEIKAQNGTPTELQEQKINQIREAGCLAHIVYPSGWNKVKDVIDGLLEERFNLERKVTLK